jgi:outer membrane lipoprotein-sorting protein
MNKMKLIRSFSILAVVVILSQHSMVISSSPTQELSPNEAEAFIQELAAILRTKKSMQVYFTQERHLSLLIEPLISKGVCFFKNPDQLRWEIVEPYKSILLFNGNRVEKYDFDEDGTPRRLTLGSEDVIREILSQITDWMRGDFSNSAQTYNIRIYKNDNDRIRLIPKSKELRENIRFIELHIKNLTKQIIQVLIEETESDFVRIFFFEEKNNLELEKRLFDLEDPLVWIKDYGR